MNNAIVTILIPHYKTPDLTRYCVDCLQKNTDLSRVKVIVIDNASNDDSASFLRTIPWVTLIERKAAPDDTPALSHARALDLALQQVDTPFVLSIHTDTFITNPRWLDFLLKTIQENKAIAGVGSWKLEKKSALARLLKKTERIVQLFYYRLIGKRSHAISGEGKNYYYLRSHCALYRADLLKKLQLSFAVDHEPAGKVLHKKLVDAGYQMIFLPSEILGQYLEHVNHATTALRPELGSRKKTITQGLRRLKKHLPTL